MKGTVKVTFKDGTKHNVNLDEIESDGMNYVRQNAAYPEDFTNYAKDYRATKQPSLFSFGEKQAQRTAAGFKSEAENRAWMPEAYGSPVVDVVGGVLRALKSMAEITRPTYPLTSSYDAIRSIAKRANVSLPERPEITKYLTGEKANELIPNIGRENIYGFAGEQWPLLIPGGGGAAGKIGARVAKRGLAEMEFALPEMAALEKPVAKFTQTLAERKAATITPRVALDDAIKELSMIRGQQKVAEKSAMKFMGKIMKEEKPIGFKELYGEDIYPAGVKWQPTINRMNAMDRMKQIEVRKEAASLKARGDVIEKQAIPQLERDIVSAEQEVKQPIPMEFERAPETIKPPDKAVVNEFAEQRGAMAIPANSISGRLDGVYNNISKRIIHEGDLYKNIAPELKFEFQKYVLGSRDKLASILNKGFKYFAPNGQMVTDPAVAWPHVAELTGGQTVKVGGKTVNLWEVSKELTKAGNVKDYLSRGMNPGFKGKDWFKNANDYWNNTTKFVQSLKGTKMKNGMDAADAVVETAKRMKYAADAPLRYMENLGVVTPEYSALLREANPNYSPMNRVIADAMGVPAKMKRSVFARRKGGEAEVGDIAGNIIDSFSLKIPWADRQYFTRRSLEMAMEHPAYKGKVTIRPVEADVDPFAKLAIAKKKMQDLKLPEFTPEQEKEIFSIFKSPRPLAKNEVYFVNKNQGFIGTVDDPVLLQSVKGLSESGNLDFIEKVMRWQKEILQTGVTTEITFPVSNMLRDFVMKSTLDPVMLAQLQKSPWKAWKIPESYLHTTRTSLKAFAKMIGKPDVLDLLEQEGMGGATFQKTMLRPAAEKIVKQVGLTGKERAIVEMGNIAKNPFSLAGHGLTGLRRISQFGERIPRLAAALDVIEKKGINPKSLQEAVNIGRNITVDFMDMPVALKYSKGIGAKVLRQVPFFTAGVNGMRRFAQAFKDYPVGASAAIIEGVMLPSAYLWWRNHDKEWYNALTPQLKNMYWWITPHFRIPKPWEVGAMGSAAERLLDAAWDKDPDGIKNSLEALWDGFIPISSRIGEVPVPMPVAGSMLYSLVAGKDPFFQSQIEPKYSEGKYRHLRAMPSTSPTLVDATREAYTGTRGMVDVSPAMTQQLMRQQMGAMGSELLKVTDFAKMSTEKGVPAAYKKVYGEGRLPIVRRVTAQNAMEKLNTDYVRDFYNIRESGMKAKSAVLAGKETPWDKKRASAYEEFIKPWESALTELNQFKKEVGPESKEFKDAARMANKVLKKAVADYRKALNQ